MSKLIWLDGSYKVAAAPRARKRAEPRCAAAAPPLLQSLPLAPAGQAGLHECTRLLKPSEGKLSWALACYRMYMVRIAISSVAQRSPVLFQLLVDRIALLGEGSVCEVLGIFLEVDEDVDRAAADEDDAGFGIGIRLPPVEA